MTKWAFRLQCVLFHLLIRVETCPSRFERLVIWLRGALDLHPRNPALIILLASSIKIAAPKLTLYNIYLASFLFFYLIQGILKNFFGISLGDAFWLILSWKIEEDAIGVAFWNVS